jgi:predicted site-specific integrase-resolvase
MIRLKPDNIEPNRLYCIKEVCNILNIHRDTLRKYTYEQLICCTKISCREIYYSGEEILSFCGKMINKCNNTRKPIRIRTNK